MEKRTIKEKGLQDGKRQRLRWREGKTTGSTEAGMMETKLVWDRKWTDEVKQKTRKTVSCNCNQSTIWRSKQRFRQAIKNKNFNCCLKVGLLEEDLSTRFGVSQSVVSQIVNTWSSLLSLDSKNLIYFLSEKLFNYTCLNVFAKSIQQLPQ